MNNWYGNFFPIILLDIDDYILKFSNFSLLTYRFSTEINKLFLNSSYFAQSLTS